MFAGYTQTVPKTEKTLKSLGFQGILANNSNFDTNATPWAGCCIFVEFMQHFKPTIFISPAVLHFYADIKKAATLFFAASSNHSLRGVSLYSTIP